jgi:hypothetical protein
VVFGRRWSAGTSRVGGLALVHVLGLRSPNGLAEPVA